MHLDQSNLLELHVCLKITLVCHSFAQTGSLGQWLDRRAGSPGAITSFFLCVVSDMVCKDQKKGKDHEEYENLSEAFNMKRNCIDGSCQLTCQVFPLL